MEEGGGGKPFTGGCGASTEDDPGAPGALFGAPLVDELRADAGGTPETGVGGCGP